MKAKASELRQHLSQLKARRVPLEPLYRDLQKYILPESGRFDFTETDSGETGYEEIIDATATQALDILGAGMLGGMTSPARPWFRLTTRRPELDENTNVKRWLADVQREMLMVFAKSNAYQALNNMYLELGTYGTACVVALPSKDTVLHLHEMTAGEYWIEEDSEGRVNTLYREILMTAQQMIERFGEKNVSEHIRTAAQDSSSCYQLFKVIQAIEPRPLKDIEPGKKDNLNFPYRSVYFEEEATPSAYSIDERGQQSSDKVLLEEGFKVFPALAPRWVRSKRSPYGRSPAMKALNTVIGLQGEIMNKDKAIDYMVNPSLLVPSQFKAKPMDFGPGGISYCDVSSAQQVVPAFNVGLRISEAAADIQDKRQQIESYFMKDMFLRLQETARYGRTAFEVDKIQKENMMIMGPVLERLHLELLDPLIDCALMAMEHFNLLPPMPDELKPMAENGIVQKQDYTEESARDVLNIEYVSVLAQAQKAAGVDAMSTYVQSLAGAAQIWPNVVDNFDSDKWSLTLADQLGVDPELVRSKEEIEALRAERAQQQQAQQQMATMQQLASSAKDMKDVLPQDGVANVMSQMSGY